MEKRDVFEVRSDFYDDVLGAWAIDCWFDADDNSEGEVVAYVDDNGNVKWNNELYKGDKMVEEEIAALIEEEDLKPIKQIRLWKRHTLRFTRTWTTIRAVTWLNANTAVR